MAKILTRDSLEKFVYSGDTLGLKRYEELSYVHTGDNFSIASNEVMAAVIYHSELENHGLNYTFGDSMDVVTSVIKICRNEVSNKVNLKITFNTKEVLNKIKSQFKELKLKAKETYNIKISEGETFVKLYADLKDNKLTTSVETRDKITNKMTYLTVSDLDSIDITNDKWKYTNQEEYNVCLNTKYFVDYLNFMKDYKEITINTIGNEITPIHSEKKDREVLLLPVKR